MNTTILKTFILFLSLCLTSFWSVGQTWEARIVNKGTMDIWEGPDLPWAGVEIRETSGTNTPISGDVITNLNIQICIPTSVYNTGVDIQGWMTPTLGSGWYFTNGNNYPPTNLFTSQSSGGFQHDLSTYTLTINNIPYTIRALVMNSTPLFFSRDMNHNEWTEITSFVLTDPNKTLDSIFICDVNSQDQQVLDSIWLTGVPPMNAPNITFNSGTTIGLWDAPEGITDISYQNGRWTYGSGPDYAPDSTDGSKNMTLDKATPLPASGVVINNLTLEAGAELSVGSGSSLQVNGSVINHVGASGFAVTADSTGYGQYIGPAIEGTFEQHVGAGSSVGWRLLSFPITDATISDISDDTPVQGIPGGSDTDADPNFFIYDSDATFEPPADVSTAWGDGLGFGLYFFNNTFHGSSTLPLTLDASGTEPSSDVTVALNPAASGYTLVGNPFASNYNTNSMTVTSSNISNNIAFWDDGTSSYSIQDRTTPISLLPGRVFGCKR